MGDLRNERAAKTPLEPNNNRTRRPWKKHFNRPHAISSRILR